MATTDRIRLVIDPSLALAKGARPSLGASGQDARGRVPDRVPEGWTQRALYLGEEGAGAWLEMMQAPGYGKNPHREGMRAQLELALRGSPARTFVSLGPGDGEPDVSLVSALAKARGGVDYIPVDLNEKLLQVAGARMKDVAQVPFGILADFESAMPFIRRTLQEHAVSPAIYGLIGSTLSNLDRGELHLLKELHETLGPDDALLLEVATKQPGWTFESDMRAHHASYALGERRLISNGIAKRSGEPAADIERDFEARIRFQLLDGQIPSASAIDAVDTKSGLVALRNGRYQLDALIAWLERSGFAVEFQSTYSVEGFTLGMAALRLRRRVSPEEPAE
jgi:hypothetical protein